MQSHGETAGADTGQLAVHPRLCIVEAPTGGQGQPLRQAPHRGVIGKPDRGAP
jgi:hypothetical protein